MDLIPADAEWTAGFLTGPTIDLKLLDGAADAGEIEGYAATFNGIDHGMDTIVPGAFMESLSAHNAAGTAPALLWNHRQAEPIGKLTAAGEDARGLRIRGKLNLTSEQGRKAHEHVKHGDATGLSIGYGIAPGGSKASAKGRILSKLHLHETSVVTVPMDPRARITGVKSLGSRAELEDMLREGGLAKGAAKKIANAGWSALSGEPASDTDDPALLDIVRALDRNILDLKGMSR